MCETNLYKTIISIIGYIFTKTLLINLFQVCVALIPNFFIDGKICTNIMLSAEHILPVFFWLLMFLKFCKNIYTIANIALHWVCYSSFIMIFYNKTCFKTAKNQVSCFLPWILLSFNKAGLWRLQPRVSKGKQQLL